MEVKEQLKLLAKYCDAELINNFETDTNTSFVLRFKDSKCVHLENRSILKVLKVMMVDFEKNEITYLADLKILDTLIVSTIRLAYYLDEMVNEKEDNNETY